MTHHPKGCKCIPCEMQVGSGKRYRTWRRCCDELSRRLEQQQRQAAENETIEYLVNTAKTLLDAADCLIATREKCESTPDEEPA